MSWDPARYREYRDERQQPFHDLLALVRRSADMDIVDLGCGTGELTHLLHAQLAARSTLGVDNSLDMLAEVADAPVLRDMYASPPGTPGLRFALADITDIDPAPRFDLVFSNAALHRLPTFERLLLWARR